MATKKQRRDKRKLHKKMQKEIVARKKSAQQDLNKTEK